MRPIDAAFVVYAAESEFSEEDAAKIRWLISHIPTIDAEPVRHGRWIDRGDYVTTAYGSLDIKVCSNCNAEVTIDQYDYYCPNCGAKMDEEVQYD